MKSLIVILLIALIVWITFRHFINTRRIVLYNRLDMVYDKMELYVATSATTIDKDMITFLESYKNIIVNPGLVDIQIFLLIQILTKNEKIIAHRNDFIRVHDSLPSTMLKLTSDFNKIVKGMIVLSMLKPSFVSYLITIVFKTIIQNGISSIPYYVKRAFEAFKNELVITPNSAKDIAFA